MTSISAIDTVSHLACSLNTLNFEWIHSLGPQLSYPREWDRPWIQTSSADAKCCCSHRYCFQSSPSLAVWDDNYDAFIHVYMYGERCEKLSPVPENGVSQKEVYYQWGTNESVTIILFHRQPEKERERIYLSICTIWKPKAPKVWKYQRITNGCGCRCPPTGCRDMGYKVTQQARFRSQ